MASTSAMLAPLRYGFASLITLTFAYGIYVVMSVITWHRLRIRRISQPGHRSMVFAYTILMFLLTFVDYVSSALVLEAALIEGPAGTSAAAGAQLCSAVGITNNVVSSLQFLLSDALMVYRTFVLFSGSRALVVLPIMLWLALAGLSVVDVVTACGLQVSQGEPVNVALYFDITTAWLSTTAALQVLTTGMIAFKLLSHRRTLIKSGASHVDGTQYTSLAGLLSESALIYTAASVAYIPMVRANSPIVYWWGQVVGSLVFLNPAFLILRVVTGQSYPSGPSAGSAIQFSTKFAGEEPFPPIGTRHDSSFFPALKTVSSVEAESFGMTIHSGSLTGTDSRC